MSYKDYNLGDWIGHISGAIEDERELDGNEMRDLVEFLTKQKSAIEDIKAEVWDNGMNMTGEYQGIWIRYRDVGRIIDRFTKGLEEASEIIDRHISEVGTSKSLPEGSE